MHHLRGAHPNRFLRFEREARRADADSVAPHPRVVPGAPQRLREAALVEQRDVPGRIRVGHHGVQSLRPRPLVIRSGTDELNDHPGLLWQYRLSPYTPTSIFRSGIGAHRRGK